MADERDPKVSQRYREMGSEEPPPELDQRILAAGRNAATQPHAPLVTPAGRHRWYFSLAAAAVVVLAVAVTVHVDRERPDPEAVVTEPAPQVQNDEAPKAEPPPPMPVPEPGRREAAPAESGDNASSERRAQGESSRPMAAPAIRGRMAEQVEEPERWLERIAQLRKEGRHEEADKALAEFRRRYPDYRVPESAERK